MNMKALFTHRLRAVPVAGALVLAGFIPLAAQAQSNPLQSMTPMAIAALCGGLGGAAGAAGGAAGGAAAGGAAGAMSGALAMLCKNSGVTLQALNSLMGMMKGSGGGGESGSGSSTQTVSSLPVIVLPQTTSTTDPLGATITGATPPVQYADYGPLVPEVVKRESRYGDSAVQWNDANSAAVGGIRLSTGEYASDSGSVRIGAYANGDSAQAGVIATVASADLNQDIRTMLNQTQGVDLFTLGYDDALNGRDSLVSPNWSQNEQFQYDSGYALGVRTRAGGPIA